MFSEESYSIDIVKSWSRKRTVAGEGDPALERLCMVLPMGTQIIFPRDETDFLKVTIYIHTLT